MGPLSRTLFAAAAATLLTGAGAGAQPAATSDRPTIVLVHGAFAESASWDGVIGILAGVGYPVIAAANPLRGVGSDAAYLSSIVSSIPGPVVLVGHSYGGAVISAAANGHDNVQALVFVGAFAPDAGETSIGLSGLYPGSTLGDALAPPVAAADGSRDLYIRQDRFRAQFAADVPAHQAERMAITQRPIAEAALSEPAGEPAWKSIPSWSIYGGTDLNIPPRALAFMAQRAGSRRTVEVQGASHVVMVSHPSEVASLIEEAASARSAVKPAY